MPSVLTGSVALGFPAACGLLEKGNSSLGWQLRWGMGALERAAKTLRSNGFPRGAALLDYVTHCIVNSYCRKGALSKQRWVLERPRGGVQPSLKGWDLPGTASSRGYVWTRF